MKNKDLATCPRPADFSFNQLVVLEWLLGGQSGRRFVVDSGLSQKLFATTSVREDGKSEVIAWAGGFDRLEKLPDTDAARLRLATFREVDEAFGGRKPVDLQALVAAGLISRYRHPMQYLIGDKPSPPFFDDKVADIHIPGKWTYDSSYAEVSGDHVRIWWESKGAARLAALREKARVKRQGLTRRAVFGWEVQVRTSVPAELASLLPPGFTINLPTHRVTRPAFAATIIRETDKRFVVEDLAWINGSPDIGKVMGTGRARQVERQYLLIDRVTEADVARLVAFDTEYSNEIASIDDAVYAQLVPVFAERARRLAQKATQHSDMFAELLASMVKPAV